MKIFSASSIVACWVLCFAAAAITQPSPYSATQLFAGSTPCDLWIKSTLKIPGEAPCEFLKIELTLNAGKKNSGSFTMNILYGVSKPNTNGFRNGGTKLLLSGNYTVEPSKDRPEAVICRLNTGSQDTSIALLKLNNSLFHILDGSGKLLVGNGGYSYTLNKIE